MPEAVAPAELREIKGRVTAANFTRLAAALEALSGRIVELELAVAETPEAPGALATFVRNTLVTVALLPADGPVSDRVLGELRIAQRDVAKRQGTYFLNGQYAVQRLDATVPTFRLLRAGPPSGRDYSRVRLVLP